MTEEINTPEKVETPIPKEEIKTPEPSQSKKERTRLEKLRHTRASIDAQIAEEEKVNGIVISDEDDDDKPLTKGDLKRMERDNAKKTALQLADSLEDEDERTNVREALETRIMPSGNPQKDYNDALNLVNAEKYKQIASTKKNGKPTTVPSGTGAPRKEEEEFIPSELELSAAAMVGKKTPADIKAFVLKARAKENK